MRVGCVHICKRNITSMNNWIICIMHDLACSSTMPSFMWELSRGRLAIDESLWYMMFCTCETMFDISRIQLLLLLLCVLNRSLFGYDSAIKLASSTPTYCIDEGIIKIVKSRVEKCFADGNVQSELSMLRNFSTADYHRSHELLAYQYFVENVDNIHRRSCDVANFE